MQVGIFATSLEDHRVNLPVGLCIIATYLKGHRVNLQVGLCIIATSRKGHRVNLQVGLYITATSRKGHRVNLLVGRFSPSAVHGIEKMASEHGECQSGYSIAWSFCLACLTWHNHGGYPGNRNVRYASHNMTDAQGAKIDMSITAFNKMILSTHSSMWPF